MSRPRNPLDKFKSHSIHYILTVSSTSEAFAPYISPKTPDGAGFLSNIVGKKLGEDIGGNVYLLIDSRKTSEFSIANVTFTSLLNENGAYGSQPLVIQDLIHMQVVDPSGVGFFNYLRYLTNTKFKTDGASLYFCLHIMFIGHTDSGTSEIVSVEGIPMIMGGEFSLSEYTTRGALYDIGFVCSSFGISSQLEHLTRLPNASISAKFANQLLGLAVQSIENQLNAAHRDWFNKANPTSKPADQNGQAKSNTDKDRTDSKGRLVRYMITIPSTWFYYKVLAGEDKTPETIFYGDGTKAAEASYKEEQAKLDQNKDNNGTFTSQIQNNIHDTLNNLLLLCPEVTAKANQSSNTTDKVLTTYKILQSVTSNDEEMVIHFDVVEYTMKNPNVKTPPVTDSVNDDAGGASPPRNAKNPDGGIEFDYLYSGLNEDVLDFNIKIDNLTVGLSTDSTTIYDNAKDISSQTQEKKNDVSPGGAPKDFVGPIQPNQPLFTPPTTSTQVVNQVDSVPSNNPLAKQVYRNLQGFHKTLSDLHFAMGQASVKIRGNPDFFGRYMVSAIPPVPKMTTSVKEFLENGNQENIDKLSQWEYDQNTKSTPKGNGSIVQAHLEHRKFVEKTTDTSPKLKEMQYAKINVYGPKDYPFSQYNGDAELAEYKVQLFYDGWYGITSVVHAFSGSDFTQELNMVTLNAYGEFDATQTSGTTNNAN